MPTAQAELSEIKRSYSVDETFEIPPMTLQVALIGTDGIVVGIDRLMTYQTREPSEPNPATQVAQLFKFVKTPDEGIVCTFAGGEELNFLLHVLRNHGTPQ